MDNCLFCKIVKGDIPSFKIYEDEHSLAFLDISNDLEGHTLVISKAHYKNILDMDDVSLMHLMSAVSKVSNHYINECGFDGVNIISNANEAAEQTIMHVHIHILPRKDNDNIHVFPNIDASNNTLESIHNKLKFK